MKSILNNIYRKYFILFLIKKYKNRDKIFEEIYKYNLWGDCESFSGTGSSLLYTENLRKELPLLLRKYNINSIFDAPCGDFNWMNEVLKKNQIKYIGADIVEALIKKNREKYRSTDAVDFMVLDLVNDDYPNADLMICRDCLFHLSYKDIFAVIERFLISNIKFILVTSHDNNNSEFYNSDIKTGYFRKLDLFSAPFMFPKNSLEIINDWVEPDPPRAMHLFSRETILNAYQSNPFKKYSNNLLTMQ